MIDRVIIFLFLFAAPMALAGSPITPGAVSQQISAAGAKSALKKMYGDHAKWSQLLGGVATGSRDWLTIANRLHHGSDAGASEQLGFAVGEALAHRPENVLSLSITEFSVDVVCGGPDVDDARFDSYERSVEAIAKREGMVRSVGSEALHQVRDSCLSALEKAKTSIAKFYGRE